LRQLRAGGLVTARRSSFDGRDTYYSLDLNGCAQALAGAASALHPALAPVPAAGPERAAVPGTTRRRVLFVCTGPRRPRDSAGPPGPGAPSRSS
jgi:hypothetical protein